MDNNQKSAWVSRLSILDKLLSSAALAYGIYLYYEIGQFDNGEFLNNPMYWVIGGAISLVIAIVNIPKLFLSRMKKNMVVSR